MWSKILADMLGFSRTVDKSRLFIEPPRLTFLVVLPHTARPRYTIPIQDATITLTERYMLQSLVRPPPSTYRGPV